MVTPLYLILQTRLPPSSLSSLIFILFLLLCIYLRENLFGFNIINHTNSSLYNKSQIFYSLIILILLLICFRADNFYFVAWLIEPSPYSDTFLYSGSILFGTLSPLQYFYRDRSKVVFNRKITDAEFAQGFAGFVDGEGFFIINIAKNSVISFRFGIHLHIDDIKVLEFIKEK